MQLSIGVLKINAWCPLKGHTYLNKPAAFSIQLQVCLSMFELLVGTRCWRFKADLQENTRRRSVLWVKLQACIMQLD